MKNLANIGELDNIAKRADIVECAIGAKEDKKAHKNVAKELQGGKALSLMELKGKIEFAEGYRYR